MCSFKDSQSCHTTYIKFNQINPIRTLDTTKTKSNTKTSKSTPNTKEDPGNEPTGGFNAKYSPEVYCNSLRECC